MQEGNVLSRNTYTDHILQQHSCSLKAGVASAATAAPPIEVGVLRGSHSPPRPAAPHCSG